MEAASRRVLCISASNSRRNVFDPGRWLIAERAAATAVGARILSDLSERLDRQLVSGALGRRWQRARFQPSLGGAEVLPDLGDAQRCEIDGGESAIGALPLVEDTRVGEEILRLHLLHRGVVATEPAGDGVRVPGPLEDGDDRILGDESAAGTDLGGLGVGLDLNRSGTKVRSISDEQSWPDRAQPVAEIRVGHTPAPRRVEVRKSFEVGIEVVPIDDLLPGEIKDPLEWVTQDTGRQDVRDGEDQRVLVGDAVLVLVDVDPLVGRREDLAPGPRFQHPAGSPVHLRPRRIARLTFRVTGCRRVCTRKAQRESRNRLHSRLSLGDAVAAQSIAQSGNSRVCVGENELAAACVGPNCGGD